MDAQQKSLVELYLELLDLNRYGSDGVAYDDPTADAAVVRTEIREWLRENYTSYNRRR